VRYLDSFASLTRDVLENSRMELTSVQKEINLLQNYLKLQKLRFGERFEYEIHVDPKINANTVMLPPMLSQPFIENAIEHGLEDLDSGGKIDVRFDVSDDLLVMEITDNGNGIQEDNPQQKKRASLAIEITRERIALLNRKNKRKSSFVISEAYPQNVTRKGVKVSFRIPIPVTL
jgi:sensor histidine kinase YesM